MKTRLILLLTLTTLIISCNSTHEKQLKEQLYGEWECVDRINGFCPPSFIPQGMTIYNDSIDFYQGFFKFDKSTRNATTYFGNITSYKIENDCIFIKSPLTGKWEYKWKFVGRKNDTLELAYNDATISKYKKISSNLDTLPEFDQIIYSSSGCFGSCPIIDISIDKAGNVLFQGEGYVKPLGLFSAKLNTQTKKYIFDKFKRANPLGLLDEYYANHTDDQSITTTFIKNGKIVKTINDYGMEGPKKLIWAYIPIANIYSKIQLDTLTFEESFYPKLHYFTFRKGDLILPLEKSESFYLWAELKKAKQSDKQFKPIYKLGFRCNYTYWGPDPNKTRKHKHEIKDVTSNGQYFKFEFKDYKPIIYDLGYNFFDRNFKQEDFRKHREYED